ncbi:MAG TPA: Asp23/Gls24 family envelope stress response protein [Candidatus Cryosericum sp.]|nr:Asp23/Gls24 family envelope stress response protein [Candidatus Cryosericum sp.]
MAAEMSTAMGKIVITDDLIASIAGYAAVENYGIVGMSAKKAADPFIELFGMDNMRRGVKVTILSPEVIDIDLYVTLEYGVSLPAVAQNAKSNVKYRVEEMTGLTVHAVNVHVENIRV